MATKNPKTAIVISTDEKPAIKGLKNLVKAYGAASTQINQGLEIITKGWGFVSGAITGTVDALSEYVQLSAEQERVELRVLAAIRRKTTFTDEDFAALQRSNAARQRALGIGDETQLQLQGTLTAMGVHASALDKATEMTIGLAEATGQDLNAASRLVARTLNGEVSALKRYGIEVGTVAEATEELGGLFDVASAQSNTLAVKMRVLDAAIGDTKEVIGDSVNNSQALKDVFDGLTDTVEGLGQALSGPAGTQLIDEMARALAGLAADALNAALGAIALKRAVEDFDQETTGGRGGALLRIMSPYHLLTEGPGTIMDDLIDGQKASVREVGGLMGEIEQLANRMQKIRAGGIAAREPALVPLVGPGSPGYKAPGVGGVGAGGATNALSLRGDVFGLEEDERAAEAARARAELLKDLEDQRRVDQLDDEFAFRAELLDAQKAADALQIEQMKAHAEAMRAPADLIAGTMQGAIAQGLRGMRTALAEGESVVNTLRGFFGGVVVAMGNTLIQMGSTALAMAPFSAIPAFWPLIGGPGVSAAVGAGALLAGGALVATGNAMGGKGGAQSPASSGGGGSFRAPALPAGEVLQGGFSGGPGQQRGAQASVINVTFNGITDPRRVRRDLQDLMAGA